MILSLSILFLSFIIANQPTSFPPEKYMNLIEQLKAESYRFALPRNINEKSQKIVLLVHDVDYSINGAKTFVQIENKSGVRSTFFLRPDPDGFFNNRTSYFSQNIRYFQLLEKQGWQIGFHYDSLSRTDGNETFALDLFMAQLSFMSSFFNITATRAHGDVFHNVNINNYRLYESNKDVWQFLGLSDFTEWGDAYYSDSNFHTWNVPETFDAYRIMINLHTDWW